MTKNSGNTNINDFIICPSCGTMNEMGRTTCKKCKYGLKTWTTFDDEVKLEKQIDTGRKPIRKPIKKREEVVNKIVKDTNAENKTENQ